jgi:large subunit ribosomal protein L22
MLEQQNVKAVGKYIRISPTKVRRVLDQIRGRSYQEALMILEFLPYKACAPIWQVLNSAAANAQNNLKIKKQNLVIKTVFADQGPTLRRFRPRAQGRGYQIRKPTCHITVILEKTT